LPIFPLVNPYAPEPSRHFFFGLGCGATTFPMEITASRSPMTSVGAGSGFGDPMTGFAVFDVELSTGTATLPIADSPTTESLHPAIPAAIAPVNTNLEIHPSRVRIPLTGSAMILVQTLVSACRSASTSEEGIPAKL
jgi:hypothetical protein